jgi:uncharacterized membrane protein
MLMRRVDAAVFDAQVIDIFTNRHADSLIALSVAGFDVCDVSARAIDRVWQELFMALSEVRVVAWLHLAWETCDLGRKLLLCDAEVAKLAAVNANAGRERLFAVCNSQS